MERPQPQPDSPDNIWRVTRTGRYGFACLPVAAAGVAIGVGSGGSGAQARGLAVAMAILFVVTAPLVWWWAFVPYVALTKNELLVRNRVMTRHITYRDIIDVSPGYHGLVIHAHNDNGTIAWAVQKANWNKWTHKRTRSDDVADAIMDRVVQVRAQTAIAHAPHQQPGTNHRAGQDKRLT